MSEKRRSYPIGELLQKSGELAEIAKERQALLNKLTGNSERVVRVRGKVAASQNRALEKGVVFLAELLSQEIPSSQQMYPELPPEKKSRRDEVYQFLTEYAAEHPQQPITLAEIASQFGFSRQRASQLYHLLEPENMLPPLSRELRIKRRQIALELLENGKSVDEVKNITGLSSNLVENEVKKLQASGDLFDAEAERKKRLERQILHLRQDLGMGNNAIADQLAISRPQVGDVLRRLEKSGEEVRLRKRRTVKELKEFDEKVKELYEKGLRLKEIVAIIGEADRYKIVNSFSRQRRKGLIPPSASQRSYIKGVVKELRLEGWDSRKITRELRISQSTVDRLLHELISQGEVQSLGRKGPLRDEAFYADVERLKKDGQTNAEIAKLLGKSQNQVRRVVRQLYKLQRLIKD